MPRGQRLSNSKRTSSSSSVPQEAVSGAFSFHASSAGISEQSRRRGTAFQTRRPCKRRPRNSQSKGGGSMAYQFVQNVTSESTDDPAHAPDGGIPSVFYFEAHWPAASDSGR